MMTYAAIKVPGIRIVTAAEFDLNPVSTAATQMYRRPIEILLSGKKEM